MGSFLWVLVALAVIFEASANSKIARGGFSDIKTKLETHYQDNCTGNRTENNIILVDSMLSWEKANDICISTNLSLVTLKSKTELDEFYNKFSEHDFRSAWVLASNCKNGLIIQWGESGPILEADSEMWFKGNEEAVAQPNELLNNSSDILYKGHLCVAVILGGLWDESCSFRYKFACECRKEAIMNSP
ncbi:Hypothetical predicted protein [Cloeon dipterum]|uniref:C-type lectin domain-containing protein n=1 Tax=Cloeon dipterum TaxID=197152 RepID=A0A8S1CXL0_9INSE|nr:Hypothetical predicted protein [Cloeon dipterum]